MKRKTFLGSLLSGMFGVVVKKGEGSLSDPGKTKAVEVDASAASGWSSTAITSGSAIRITRKGRRGMSA